MPIESITLNHIKMLRNNRSYDHATVYYVYLLAIFGNYSRDLYIRKQGLVAPCL